MSNNFLGQQTFEECSGHKKPLPSSFRITKIFPHILKACKNKTTLRPPWGLFTGQNKGTKEGWNGQRQGDSPNDHCFICTLSVFSQLSLKIFLAYITSEKRVNGHYDGQTTPFSWGQLWKQNWLNDRWIEALNPSPCNPSSSYWRSPWESARH